MRVTRESSSTDYTAALGASLAALLHEGDVIRLVGDLGAGKTTLVRALGRALRIPDGLASSPTFVFVNDYPLTTPVRGIAHLIHVDAYRLRGSDEIDTLGWDRFMLHGRAAPGHAVVCEWPERIEDALPPKDSCVQVTIEHADETTRLLTIDLPESFRGRPGTEAFLEREPIRCPTTGTWVEPTRPSYPFAGERERLADLNKWFTGAYTISRDIRADDLDAER
ncbi:MAG: tRNA (adenosine(37)-N6)-threonylcarbamoyltransferase complex ATPase subunit type 1 TsaE [Phycisphaerae bacterium]